MVQGKIPASVETVKPVEAIGLGKDKGSLLDLSPHSLPLQRTLSSIMYIRAGLTILPVFYSSQTVYCLNVTNCGVPNAVVSKQL